MFIAGSLLVVALVSFWVAMRIAIGSGAVLVGSAPVAPDASPTTAAVPATGGQVQQHLVLIVSDPQLGAALRKRIVADRMLSGEHGALSPRTTFEVIVLPEGGGTALMHAGLREYDAQCVAVACPAIRVIDLRLDVGGGARSAS